MTGDVGTDPMVWCEVCDRYTTLHLLVHLINDHSPRMGSRSAGQRSWRVAVLADRPERRRAA